MCSNNSLSFALVLLTLFPLGCDESGDTETELRVVVNVPGDLPLQDESTQEPISVVIEFKAIEVHHVERGWINQTITAKLDLANPADLPKLLSGIRLPYGRYDALRFYDTAAYVVVGRNQFPLEITGDKGFYVSTSFCIDGPGEVDHLELDWEIENNLHYDRARGWWLDPKLVVTSAPSCEDQCR